MSKKARKNEFVGHYEIGGDERARLKYEILLQDYHELRQESEAKKKKLQKVNQKKFQLLNEVRFLRRKYEKLIKNPQQNQYVVLKKQVLHDNPNSEDLYDTKSIEAPSTSRISNLDLNQTNEEEIEEPVMKTVDLKGQNYKKDEKERGFLCRDFGTGMSSRTGKRKITWKDQVVLQV